MTSLSRRQCRRQSETADYVNRKENVIQIACLAYIFCAIPYRRAVFLFRMWLRLHLKPRINWRANYISMRCNLPCRRKYLLPSFLKLIVKRQIISPSLRYLTRFLTFLFTSFSGVNKNVANFVTDRMILIDRFGINLEIFRI